VAGKNLKKITTEIVEKHTVLTGSNKVASNIGYYYFWFRQRLQCFSCI